jgi:hypothetical protein
MDVSRFDISRFLTSSFLAEIDRRGVEFSFEELTIAALPFDIESLQENFDQRASRRRLLREDIARKEDEEDRQRLESLVRAYAQILIRAKQRRRIIDERVAYAAKEILKRTGRGCDTFPC